MSMYKFAVILKLILHPYHIFLVKDGCYPQEHMHVIEKANGIRYLYASPNRQPYEFLMEARRAEFHVLARG